LYVSELSDGELVGVWTIGAAQHLYLPELAVGRARS
jgi:hypothetical protein